MSEYDSSAQNAPAPVGPETGEGSFTPPPPVAEPRKRSRSGAFLLGAFSGCLVVVVAVLIVLVVVVSARQGTGQFTLSTQKIAVVPIEGEIFEARETVDLIQKYGRSSTVRGIVVRINSPGGAIAPSQEIYSAILSVKRKSGKPVVASLDNVAASGGFLIASACDEIVANPGTITGSIGVILQWLNVEDLVRWAKMKPQTITSGSLKDAGSPFRQLSEEERHYFQRIVQQLHAQFVRAVVNGRKGKLSEDEIRLLSDGRVFTGEEAHALKLVDRIGTLHDAVALAGSKAGIKGDPATIYPRRREVTLLDLLTDTSDSKALIEYFLNRRGARFLYMWDAGSVSVK